jgi:hypothetical protein
MEPEILDHIAKINAQPLIDMEGETVTIVKLSNNNGKDTAVEVGFRTTGKLTVLKSDAVIGVLVEDSFRQTFIRTSIVVNVEPIENGVLAHTLNSTYRITGASSDEEDKAILRSLGVDVL